MTSLIHFKNVLEEALQKPNKGAATCITETKEHRTASPVKKPLTGAFLRSRSPHAASMQAKATRRTEASHSGRRPSGILASTSN